MFAARLGLARASSVGPRLKFSASSSADASVCRLVLLCRPAPQSTVSWRLKSTNRLLPEFAVAASTVGCRLNRRLRPQSSAAASTVGCRLNCRLPPQPSAGASTVRCQLTFPLVPHSAIRLRLSCLLASQLSACASTVGCCLRIVGFCLNYRLLPQLMGGPQGVNELALVARHTAM